MGSDDQKSHNKTFRNHHVVITMDLLDIVEKLDRTRAELTSLEKFVLEKFVLEKFVLEKFVLEKFVLEKFVLEKFVLEKFVLEKFVTALPADPALMLTIAGVRKRQEHLGLRFAQATEQQSKEARRGPE